MRVRLYVGLKREGTWFNYADVEEIRGGSLALLDGDEKSGAARLLNLVQKCTFRLYSGEGGEAEEYLLKPPDYLTFKVADTWKITREAMKLVNNTEELKFPEFFYCSVCSTSGNERYTELNDDWDQLVIGGFIDEIYLEDDTDSFWVDLPVGIEIPGRKEILGGHFTRIRRTFLTIGDMLSLQKNAWAQKNEANMICTAWDASIIEVEGMSQREFQIFVKRSTGRSFTKEFMIAQADIDTMTASDDLFEVGYIATDRQISCSTCHADIGGMLDWTNFFQSLLSKKSSQDRMLTHKV